MKLPSSENAIVSRSRLTSYLLNAQHPDGRHKARVFASALGFDLSAADEFRDWLLRLAQEGEAEIGRLDAHGQRFVIRGKLLYKGREAQVRTGWIIRTGAGHPEFLTAFVE